MAVTKRKSTRPRKAVVPRDATSVAPGFRIRALLLVDNGPLQRAAWAEFHSVRKRLDKISGDLHRHEEVDSPAYDEWMYQTFPAQISRLRQLQEEVYAKGKQVETVQALGYLTGRPLKKLWREMKEREEHPELFEDEPGLGEDPHEPRSRRAEEDDWDDEHFEEEESRGRSSRNRGYGRREDDAPSASAGRQGPAPSSDAKAIYRRLVQRLHPDRGGDWTPARQRLWHDVQQAWATGDADWLGRLEVEWETANEQLGPTSPLSRLRQAIAELHGARRDLEKKIRDYRGAFSWRFTRREKHRAELRRKIEANFQHDLAYLAGQLRYLDATIAAWEGVSRRRRPAYD